MNQKIFVSLRRLDNFFTKLKDTFSTLGHKHTLSDLTDYTVDSELSSTSDNPVANSVLDAEFDAIATAMNVLETSIDNTNDHIVANYNESIIGLSIDGQTITYIKGDGSVHTMITQDTNTEYFLATDEVSGLTKLYATVGSAEDGTMTQKAIKTELDKKVGVTTDDDNDMLIFTI